MVEKQMRWALLRWVAIGFLLSGCASGAAAAQQPCGIENCHGVDIVCGPKVPDMCTAMYGLGDFCRSYAHCEVKDGQCQLVKGTEFDDCVACVKVCNDNAGENPLEAFNCEMKCRESFEGTVTGTFNSEDK